MSKSFIKSTKAKVLILSILVLTMTTMLFGGYVVSAETNEDTAQDLTPQPRNLASIFNLVFGDEVFEVKLTAANYIWPFKDTAVAEIDTRDGSVPQYRYEFAATFYDENGNFKYSEARKTVDGQYETSARTISIECGNGWEWAADYAVMELEITYNGQTKTTGAQILYFWD